MILKKIIIVILLTGFLNGCAQNTVLLGPIYTLGTTGNGLHAGFNYGSNMAINKITGKTPGENIKEILEPKKNNSELRKLLKKRIAQTRKKLNLTEQNIQANLEN